MNHKLRDDMMFFYGQLQAMQWARIARLEVSADMIENMSAQYESILKRLYEDFNAIGSMEEMNDFTKEELADLKDYINYAVSHSYGPTADKVGTIYNKIQSMIDNYCEHEPHGDFHVCVDKCKKCGVIVNDN